MTQEEYTEVQKAQVVKDKSLVKYFTQIGDAGKAAICRERAQVIE
jgi:hypothetical protein